MTLMTLIRWMFCAWLLIGIHPDKKIAIFFEAFHEYEVCEKRGERLDSLKKYDPDLPVPQMELRCVPAHEGHMFAFPNGMGDWPSTDKKEKH